MRATSSTTCCFHRKQKKKKNSSSNVTGCCVIVGPLKIPIGIILLLYGYSKFAFAAYLDNSLIEDNALTDILAYRLMKFFVQLHTKVKYIQKCGILEQIFERNQVNSVASSFEIKRNLLKIGQSRHLSVHSLKLFQSLETVIKYLAKFKEYTWHGC